MVRKKQTRKYGKIKKKKYSLKRKKSSQFRKKRRQRRTKKIIGGFMGVGNPFTSQYWDHKYSEEKKKCWKEKRSLSTNDYNTCKRKAYLNYLVKKEGKDYINKMKTRIKQLNDKTDAPEYREYWEEIYTQENKKTDREPGMKFENDTFTLDDQGIKTYIKNYIRKMQSHHASKHKDINIDEEEIFSELTQFI